ncbi:MAG: hypothetical protein IPG17_20355 [Sandaracinaceae bacterium]|nr:hypothetical protein [Sandaracinaceae bacterium]MBK6808808.1 hypothetical protein [Sandaracinaceae bacterium]MBK7150377.1 hypothetical protein [Sandaracinaceae bacterium]MBK7777284.1 hypothetical protein [Sandaracinaceae bacterium]MBK8408784.1 hypothetical protein [Sandaracinaceae bacterium]
MSTWWPSLGMGVCVPVGLLLFGVVVVGCTLRATHGDYGAYRTYRLAEDPHERSIAGADYLVAYPEGVYANEVRAALGAEEERFYAARAGSAQGLRDYLRVYPAGVHSQRARAELLALGQREAEDATEAERAREAQEAAAADALRAHRGFTREQLTLFLGVLLRVDSWGQPMAQVVQRHPELDRAFASLPRPLCDAARCVKTLHVSFALPTQGGAVAQRVSELRVVLRLEDERLLGAEIWLSGFGFSRWSELENRSPVDDADPEQRRAAIAWALQQVAPLLEAGLGDSFEAAERPALPSSEPSTPLVLLDAGALSVDVVVAGEGSAGLDGLVIGPRAPTP